MYIWPLLSTLGCGVNITDISSLWLLLFHPVMAVLTWHCTETINSFYGGFVLMSILILLSAKTTFEADLLII